MKRTFFALLTVVLFAACSKSIISPTQADADRTATKYSGLTLADLQKGQNLFKENCGSCHPHNKSYGQSEDRLNKIVPKMAGKAKLDNASGELVLKYLIAVNTRK